MIFDMATGESEENDVEYELVHPYSEPINPLNDFVDISVRFRGSTYSGAITTTRFIEERMRLFGLSGENGNGSYFCAKDMLVLKNLNDETIRATLEDLVNRGDLKLFLSSV